MENKDYPLEELLPIVAELAIKYTGYEHSSIPYEKAQMLMEGVLYCINESGENTGNTLMGKPPSAKEAYQCGQEIVVAKTRKLYALYNELMTDFQDYGLICLRDTMTKDIPLFLSNYDFKYAPQETLVIPDYPIPRDLSAFSGVDLMLKYVECIYEEQQFLGKMDAGYVKDILRAYHPDYEELFINIREIIYSASS